MENLVKENQYLEIKVSNQLTAINNLIREINNILREEKK